jgi:hypothetical protein
MESDECPRKHLCSHGFSKIPKINTQMCQICKTQMEPRVGSLFHQDCRACDLCNMPVKKMVKARLPINDKEGAPNGIPFGCVCFNAMTNEKKASLVERLVQDFMAHPSRVEKEECDLIFQCRAFFFFISDKVSLHFRTYLVEEIASMLQWESNGESRQGLIRLLTVLERIEDEASREKVKKDDPSLTPADIAIVNVMIEKTRVVVDEKKGASPVDASCPTEVDFVVPIAGPAKVMGKKIPSFPLTASDLALINHFFSGLTVHSSKPVHIDIMDVTLSLEDLILIGRQSQKNGNVKSVEF